MNETTFGKFKSAIILCKMIDKTDNKYLKKFANRQIQSFIKELKCINDIKDIKFKAMILKNRRMKYLNGIETNKKLDIKHKSFIKSVIVTLVRKERERE